MPTSKTKPQDSSVCARVSAKLTQNHVHSATIIPSQATWLGRVQNTSRGNLGLYVAQIEHQNTLINTFLV